MQLIQLRCCDDLKGLQNCFEKRVARQCGSRGGRRQFLFLFFMRLFCRCRCFPKLDVQKAGPCALFHISVIFLNYYCFKSA